MSNGFGFENSGTWGGAGIALGVGIIEGRIEAQRHREMVTAIQNNNETRSYIADLEQASRAAEIRLLQTEFRAGKKEAQLAHLNKLISQYKNLDADRIKMIIGLRDTLVNYDASTQRLIAQKDKVIAAQGELLAKRSDIIKLMDTRIQNKDGALTSSEKQIALLKTAISFMEKQVDALTRRGDRLERMLAEAELKVKRWKSQYEAMRAERDEYFDRLVRLARGEDVPNLTAPATASITDAIDAKGPGA